MADVTAPLAARLEEDMKSAMRAGEKLRLGVIRRARAAVKNAEIASREALDEAAIEKTLRGMVKQHRESIEQYEAAGRTDLADVERAEMAIIDEYLPQQLDAAAIEPVVVAAIAELGASSPKDMGAVMKAAMAKLGGAADGKEVSAIVKRLLGG
jgi:uncharacterized protein YqeY